MIPVLFPSDATDFTTQGLGALTDAISCTVTEERNGVYELEMEYPANGIHAEDIGYRSIITAIPSPYRSAQPFRVYKITTPMDGAVTIYAQHISYDLSGIPVLPFTAASASLALEGLKTNSAVDNPFSFSTDVSASGTFVLSVPTACRSCLGGVDGSILDTYGGEYEFDGLAVYLHSQRGTDAGVTIRYGKNLTDLSQEMDGEATVTGILPYWYSEETETLVTGGVVSAADYGYSRIVIVDFSEDFEEAPTVEALEAAAEAYFTRNDLDEISISLEVSFVQLEQMSGYEDARLLEQCDLCDTVTVQYEPLGVDVTAKIVSIETDVLLERYNSVTVGSIAANIAQTIVDQQKEVAEKVSTSVLQRAIENATDLITGANGGYVVLRRDASGKPYEILIMDTEDIDTATKVWRWNQNGWGYSATGYNGPYTLAATMDGAIVADFITTGTMSANRIKGGTLTLGGADNGNGVMELYDENGTLIATLDREGLVFIGSDYQTEMEDGFITIRSLTDSYRTILTPSDIRIMDDDRIAAWMTNALIQLTNTTPEATVQINGNSGNAYFAGTVTQGSDRRLKDGIQTVPGELVDALLDLKPKEYCLKASGKKAFGFVAQDVQGTPLEEALVVETDGGMLHMDYTSLHALEVAALQRMRDEIESFRAELSKLKGANS